MTIGVVDYGLGNSRSVLNALEALGRPGRLVSDAAGLSECAGIILPGVGSFGDGMRGLRERGLVDGLDREVRQGGRPFLGICLGMQLLATTGLEHGRHEGLNWIRGTADRIPVSPDDPELRVPHIGWNDVRALRGDGLYAGLGSVSAFYFVHSYVFVPEDPGTITGSCAYGREFAASVEWKNIWGTQYHPEKSHRTGLAVLANWCRRC